MNVRLRARRVGMIVGMAVLLSMFPGCRSEPIGEQFQSQATLEAKFTDFVVIGAFGEEYPATLKRIEEGDGKIEFVRKDGSRHSYPGYDNYKLRVLFMETRDGTESVLVLRSREQQ